jgi:hypothetical protein
MLLILRFIKKEAKEEGAWDAFGFFDKSRRAACVGS